MRILSVLLISFVVFNISFGQDCNFQTCKDCTASQGCGWCAATQRCLAGDAMGPSGNEPCYVSWEFGSCPSCNTYLDCKTCQIHDADCYWCATANSGKGGCLYYGQQLGCPVTHVCPCGDWSTCSDCTSDSNCQWCESSNGGGVCASTIATCPDNSLSTHTCPCSSNLDCPACKSASNCAWCDDTSNCYKKGDLTACNFHQVGNTTCSAYCAAAASDCFSCNELQGCVWCSDTKTCNDEDTAKCQREPQCAKCARHRYCDPCLDSYGCKWCEGPSENYCADSCPTFEALTCLSYCNALTVGGCQSCNAHTGCAWCNDHKTCVDADKTGGCMVALSCKESGQEKCGFDGGAFVGGMFLIIGLAVVGGGGYYFYKYKTGKSSSYNQL